jgi:hypothetical protein
LFIPTKQEIVYLVTHHEVSKRYNNEEHEKLVYELCGASINGGQGLPQDRLRKKIIVYCEKLESLFNN